MYILKSTIMICLPTYFKTQATFTYTYPHAEASPFEDFSQQDNKSFYPNDHILMTEE